MKILMMALAAMLMLATSCKNEKDDTDPTQIISSGSWRVGHYMDSGNDETSDFIGYSFVFSANGTLTATRNGISKTATKQQFLQSLPEAGILHLATHASASDTAEGSAFIAFYPDSDDHLLLASEIYSLDLDSTKLVILSACETGTGELERGEGVMSLSRAFAYAGCQNVITSLWKADDASTSYLLRRVHDHLLEGESIDQALSLARKDYLGDPAINPRRKAPAYWAHLVFIGNYEPERKLNILPWIIAAFALIALTAFIIKKAPGKVGAGGFR